jgi:hypothetical protein
MIRRKAGDLMASNLPAVVPAPATTATKQMPEPALGEDMGSFLARCVVDETMMSQHANSSDRRSACEALWADDQMQSEAGDMPMIEDGIVPPNGNPGIIPPEHRAIPALVVHFNDTAARKQRVGKPNSQLGSDGKRHSVRLMS